MKHRFSRWFHLFSILILLLVSACQLPTNPPPPTATLPEATSTSTLPPTPTPAPAFTLTPASSPPPGQTPSVPAATPPGTAKNLVVGYYFMGSAARGYKISDIPANQLDVIIYAFLGLTPSGECFPLTAGEDSANFSALRQLKLKYPQLKILFSVGGASQSTLFSDIAATDALRTHFAQNCVAFMKQNGFSGIDIDWEFPVSGGAPGTHHSPADKQNFTALLAALRAQLDAQGASDNTHYLLTIAASAGPSNYANLDLNGMATPLDWIDLMAYDFATQASTTTAFTSPLFASRADPSPNRLTYNADAAVKAYLAAGVPPGKLVLGTTLYGRGWQGVPAANNGLYQADSGPSQGTWDKDGVYGYQDLLTNYLPAYTHFFDSEAMVPWLYNPATQIFISYADPQALTTKANYVTTHHLAGMMLWELSFDDAQHTLLTAISAQLHPAK